MSAIATNWLGIKRPEAILPIVSRFKNHTGELAARVDQQCKLTGWRCLAGQSWALAKPLEGLFGMLGWALDPLEERR